MEPNFQVSTTHSVQSWQSLKFTTRQSPRALLLGFNFQQEFNNDNNIRFQDDFPRTRRRRLLLLMMIAESVVERDTWMGSTLQVGGKVQRNVDIDVCHVNCVQQGVQIVTLCCENFVLPL